MPPENPTTDNPRLRLTKPVVRSFIALSEVLAEIRRCEAEDDHEQRSAGRSDADE